MSNIVSVSPRSYPQEQFGVKIHESVEYEQGKGELFYNKKKYIREKWESFQIHL